MQEGTNAAHLREQAQKCRRLADMLLDQEAVAALRRTAAEYDAKADELDGTSLDGVPQPKITPRHSE